MLATKDYECKGLSAHHSSRGILLLQTSPRTLQLIHHSPLISRQKRTQITLPSPPTQLLLHPTLDYFLVSYNPLGTAQLYSLHSPTPQTKINYHAPFHKATFSQTHPYIVLTAFLTIKIYDFSGYFYRQIKITNFKEGRRPARLSSFSPGGEYYCVVVAGENKRMKRMVDCVKVFWTKTWEVMFEWWLEDVESVAGVMWMGEFELCVYDHRAKHYVRKLELVPGFEGRTDEQEKNNQNETYNYNEKKGRTKENVKKKTNEEIINFYAGKHFVGIQKVGMIGKKYLLVIQDKGFRLLNAQNFNQLSYTQFFTTTQHLWQHAIFIQQKDDSDDLITKFQIKQLTHQQLKRLFFTFLIKRRAVTHRTQLNKRGPKKIPQKPTVSKKIAADKPPKKGEKLTEVTFKVSKFTTEFTAFKVLRHRKLLLIWNNFKSRWAGIIEMHTEIKSFEWCPTKNYICFVTRGDVVSFWSPEGAASQRVNFQGCQISSMKTSLIDIRKMLEENSIDDAEYEVTKVVWDKTDLLHVELKSEKNQGETVVRLIQIDEEVLGLMRRREKTEVEDEWEMLRHEREEIKKRREDIVGLGESERLEDFEFGEIKLKLS